MVANKNTTKIVIAVMAVAVVLCLLAVACSQKLSDALGGVGVSMEYEKELFDTDEIISINIKMDEDDWDKMLKNATSEEYYTCDVVINGQTVYNVGIRPKGNTSLSAIAMDPDTDRFSFKLEFDHFVDGQTCYGLDKLILNNNYADATNIKEAIIYDMFQYIGAEASLYNYASISLNGEYKGVYLALEGVEKSFMLRNFGTQDGELYKPDSMEMGGGKDKASSGGPSGDFGEGGPSFGGFPGGDFDPENMPDFDPENMPDFDFNPENMPDMGDFKPGDMSKMSDDDTDDTYDDAKSEPKEADEISDNDKTGERDVDVAKADNKPGAKEADDGEREKRPGGGGGGPFMGGNGANLNYTDDDLDSYSTIWDGDLSGTSEADHRRVVKALKNISEGNDLEKYLDVDNVLKYMAVHAFSVNQDSLSGSMAHNYYLYEYEGQLNIFPWDYNLSLGGMSMGNSGSAANMINDAIDTPFDGTDFFDALLENEEYLERYHEYLRILTEEYVDGGRFDEVYSRIRSRIDELVKEDPTAFYNYDEYTAGAEMLYKTVMLRAESIEGQLKGLIPSTDEEQKSDSSSFVDASDIDTDVMGQFNMGGVEKGNEGKRRGGREKGQGGRPAGNMQPPSFGGMPGQTSNEGMIKNLVTYGICLVGMLVMLLVFKKIKRRRAI